MEKPPSVRWVLVVYLLANVSVLSACSESVTVPTVPAGGKQITVAAVSPAVGTTLTRGAQTTITLTAISHLPFPARVAVSLRDQYGTVVPASAPDVDLAALGEGTLSASFVVPANASSIELLAELDFADKSEEVVLTVRYPAS